MQQAQTKDKIESSYSLAENILIDSLPFIPLLKSFNCFYSHSKRLENYIVDQDGSVHFQFSRNKPI